MYLNSRRVRIHAPLFFRNRRFGLKIGELRDDNPPRLGRIRLSSGIGVLAPRRFGPVGASGKMRPAPVSGGSSPRGSSLEADFGPRT